jgi:hypothetical protein
MPCKGEQSMTKPTRDEIEKLNPVERVELELKLAAEYGRSPRRMISLDPQGSAQRSTPAQFSPGSTLLPTAAESRKNDLDVRRIFTEPSAIPDAFKPVLFRGTTQSLFESISSHLEQITPDNRFQMLELISEQLLALQLQSGEKDIEAIQTLQEHIAQSVLGIDKFKDLPRQNGGASAPNE